MDVQYQVAGNHTLFIYLPAFLDTGLPRGNVHKRDLIRSHARRHPYPIPQPIKVGHTTGVYDPYSFRIIVMWVLLCPTRTNQCKCCDMGPTVFHPYPRRLESLYHLQMSLQREHFLLSYLKILSVGPAGVWTCNLPLSRLVVSQLSYPGSEKMNISCWFPCGADGQASGRVGGCKIKWLPKFLGWLGNQIFLAMGLHLHVLCACVELCYYTVSPEMIVVRVTYREVPPIQLWLGKFWCFG